MESLLNLLEKLLPLAVKSQALLDAVMSVLAFIKANPQLIELVVNWFSDAFGSTADSNVPDGLAVISYELQTLKAAM